MTDEDFAEIARRLPPELMGKLTAWIASHLSPLSPLALQPPEAPTERRRRLARERQERWRRRNETGSVRHGVTTNAASVTKSSADPTSESSRAPVISERSSSLLGSSGSEDQKIKRDGGALTSVTQNVTPKRRRSSPTTPTLFAEEPIAPSLPSAFVQVRDAYFASFTEARGVAPIFDARDGKAVKELLEKTRGDAAACAQIIANAFADRWGRENSTIRTIAANPAKWQRAADLDPDAPAKPKWREPPASATGPRRSAPSATGPEISEAERAENLRRLRAEELFPEPDPFPAGFAAGGDS